MELKHRDEGITRGQRFGFFFNVILICVLGSALAMGTVVLVKRLSQRMDLRVDVTRDARYTLDAESERLIRSLSERLDVKLIWGIDQDIQQRCLDPYGQPNPEIIGTYYIPLIGEIRGRVGEVLTEWKNASKLVELEYVDGDRNPRRLERLTGELGREGGDLLNKIVLRFGGRERVVPLRRVLDATWGFFPPDPRAPRQPPQIVPGSWRVQAELTAALRALINGEAAKIGVPTGLRSRFEPGEPDFKDIAANLASEGFRLVPVSLTAPEGLPNDLAALLIPGANIEPDGVARKAIADFEARGGRVLLLADPRRRARFDWLLEPYGAQLLPGLISDPEASQRRIEGGAVKATPEIRSNRLCTKRHVISAPLVGEIPLYLGFCSDIQVGNDHAPGAVRTTLLRGSDNTQRIAVRFDPKSGKVEAVNAERSSVSGRPSYAVAMTRPVDEHRTREARLVVVGGTGVLTPEGLRLYSFGNRDFILNSLSWLVERPLMAAKPDVDREGSRITPVEKSFAPFFWMSVIGLPILALAFAVSAAFLRRS